MEDRAKDADLHKGRVASFNESKDSDLLKKGRYHRMFFHVNAITQPVKVQNKLSFELKKNTQSAGRRKYKITSPASLKIIVSFLRREPSLS